MQVLQQERLEYNRQQQRSDTSAPAMPDAMDNETFFLNLPPDLRRNILSDMDDSLINHLPERMRSEAQSLRQERDSRRRHILEQRHAMLERMMEEAHVRLSHGGSGTSGGNGGGGGGDSRRSLIGRREADIFNPGNWLAPVSSQGLRYAVVNVNPHMLDMPSLGALPGAYNFSGRVSGGGNGSLSIHHSKLADQNSKQMLDQEALTCLLVLLFLDQSKLHNNRLHRIIRNLSQHSPTRAWILSSLLAIIKEMKKSPVSVASPFTAATNLSSTCPMPPSLVPKDSDASSNSGRPSGQVFDLPSTSMSSVGVVSCTPTVVSSQPQPASSHWLDMSINAALGSHAKIFQFASDTPSNLRSSKGGGGGPLCGSSVSISEDISTRVTIHPLAGTSICHNVLDLLVFLGRHFGSSFLPSDLLPRPGSVDKGAAVSSTAAEGSDDPKKKEDEPCGEVIVTNFWQILLKLDSVSSRKGKGSLKGFKYSGAKDLLTNQTLFSNSILGQLMGLLSHEIIRDNSSLVDKLLRTLSIASNSIPKAGLKSITDNSQKQGSLPAVGEEISSSVLGVGSDKAGPSDKPGRDGYTSEMSMVAPQLLQNVISVLISGRCSEEGLEEATTLLTNLSKCSISTREVILFMLLDGVRTIGRTLCSQIAVLMDAVRVVVHEQALEAGIVAGGLELQDVQSKNNKKKFSRQTSGQSSSGGGSNILAGVVLPNSGTDDQQHVDHSHDLHIPAMEPLTCKGSQQSFFVRMLKVVCQLRESAQQAVNASKPVASSSSGAIAPPAAAAGATSNMEGTPESSSANVNPVTSSSTQPHVPAPSALGGEPSSGSGLQASEQTSGTVVEPSSEQPSVSGNAQGQTTAQQGSSSSASLLSHKPEVVLSLLGGTTDAVGNSESKPSFLKQTLSLQLELEELWSVLSECLDALSRTEDPHAVFVLQPTVEAFFLVHANYKEESSEGKKRAQDAIRSRLSRISSLHGASDTDGIPVSPAPAPFSPLPGTPGPGEGDFDPFAHLPPDTARFLKFAGRYGCCFARVNC